MQKFSNISIQARHGLERTGLMPKTSSSPAPTADGMSSTPAPGTSSFLGVGAHQLPFKQQRTPVMPGGPPMAPLTAAETIVHLSFNVPFASTLAGPKPAEILHASPHAVERWTFPVHVEAHGLPTHCLPVHQHNLDQLRRLCRLISDNNVVRVEAAVTSAEPSPIPALQRRPLRGLVTNVCVSGDPDVAHKMRAKILNETPIALKCALIDIDTSLVIKPQLSGVRKEVLDHIDAVAKYTGTDIFLTNPKSSNSSSPVASYGNGSDTQFDQRLQVAVYGDPESSEHAKMRILIMIDQILNRHIDIMKLEHSLHTITCGRTRKAVRQIEAASNTAIYFPPPFPQVYGYMPPGAHRRGEDEVYITGESKQNIERAKRQLADLVLDTKCYVKDVMVSPNKIDSILLDRLDKVRQIMDMHGSYVLFPQLGSQRGLIRVQGTEIVHVERTVREIMALAGQFYSASWWLMDPPSSGATSMRAPSPADARTMLSDICTNSGAEVGFEKLIFSISGSDEAVKAAMMIIYQIPFVKRAHYQIRIKIELANEHKEFVSGKKNGKINKIMGQSNVQIIFDGFNEYNFYIDVCGAQYESARNGLELVEQEMPASISFHVPDQYHKRIIGIGGQHIQRIMKRYSVFVKFSNAVDRGNVSVKETEDLKFDNVVCRTPARNAQTLDQVKQDIMDMVEKDAEFVTETVVINRLYHRQLIAHASKIEDLERKWNCRIEFPTTEMASDVVSISGPEYQVPQAVDEFLGMVPESHELAVPASDQLKHYLESEPFTVAITDSLREQYEVRLQVKGLDERGDDAEFRLILQYTRNNAGGLKDAVDFLVASLVPHGLEETSVKGALPRPQSDSFEDSLPFFDSKLLHNATTPVGIGSPTQSSFGDNASDRGSLFGKIRKPGSMSSISSFLDRRRNQSSSQISFFKQASSNVSRASLISMESRDSGNRNPWNDSGVSLPEGEETVGSGGWPLRFDNKSVQSLHSFTGHPHSAGHARGNSGSGMSPSFTGDMTPRHDQRASHDSGRPSTSQSTSAFPTPIGPPRPRQGSDVSKT